MDLVEEIAYGLFDIHGLLVKFTLFLNFENVVAKAIHCSYGPSGINLTCLHC